MGAAVWRRDSFLLPLRKNQTCTHSWRWATDANYLKKIYSRLILSYKVWRPLCYRYEPFATKRYTFSSAEWCIKKVDPPVNCCQQIVYYVEESGSSFLERDIAVSVIDSLSSEWEVPSSFTVLGRQRRSLQLKSPTTTLSCYGAIHYVKKETNIFDP